MWPQRTILRAMNCSKIIYLNGGRWRAQGDMVYKLEAIRRLI